MFGVSFPELCVIFGVALLIFGPEKLPEIARTLGRFAAEFRKQSDAVRREFYNAVYTPAQTLTDELKEAERKLRAVGNEIKGDIGQPIQGVSKPSQSPLMEGASQGAARTPSANCESRDCSTERKPK